MRTLQSCEATARRVNSACCLEAVARSPATSTGTSDEESEISETGCGALSVSCSTSPGVFVLPEPVEECVDLLVSRYGRGGERRTAL